MKTRSASGRGPKYVYSFANGKAEGSSALRPLLGGKGCELAEMTNLGVPVPPGFTITTEAWAAYNAAGGKWVIRWYVGEGAYKVETIAVADDKADSGSGEVVLDWRRPDPSHGRGVCPRQGRATSEFSLFEAHLCIARRDGGRAADRRRAQSWPCRHPHA